MTNSQQGTAKPRLTCGHGAVDTEKLLEDAEDGSGREQIGAR